VELSEISQEFNMGGEDGQLFKANSNCLPIHIFPIGRLSTLNFCKTSLFSNKDAKIPSPLKVYAIQGQCSRVRTAYHEVQGVKPHGQISGV
jgi:hypothetical protein